MPTDSDYVIFFGVLLAVLGAGLLRVGLMNLKREPPPEKGGYSSLSVPRSVLQQC
jgi:hypothetical protein